MTNTLTGNPGYPSEPGFPGMPGFPGKPVHVQIKSLTRSTDNVCAINYCIITMSRWYTTELNRIYHSDAGQWLYEEIPDPGGWIRLKEIWDSPITNFPLWTLLADRYSVHFIKEWTTFRLEYGRNYVCVQFQMFQKSVHNYVQMVVKCVESPIPGAPGCIYNRNTTYHYTWSTCSLILGCPTQPSSINNSTA